MPRSEAPKVEPLQVVGFRHTDPVFGTEYSGAGVVVAVSEDGSLVTVRPLQPHSVQVPAANVALPSSLDEDPPADPPADEEQG